MSTSASETTASAACPHLQRFHLTPPAERPLDEPDYFAELRETCPVSRVELPSGKQAWLFTAYDDVARAMLAALALPVDESFVAALVALIDGYELRRLTLGREPEPSLGELLVGLAELATGALTA